MRRTLPVAGAALIATAVGTAVLWTHPGLGAADRPTARSGLLVSSTTSLSGPMPFQGLQVGRVYVFLPATSKAVRVRYSLDGKPVGLSRRRPFALALPTTNLSHGPHRLVASLAL